MTEQQAAAAEARDLRRARLAAAVERVEKLVRDNPDVPFSALCARAGISLEYARKRLAERGLRVPKRARAS